MNAFAAFKGSNLSPTASMGLAISALSATAVHYDLNDKLDRTRSTKDLQALFFGLQRLMQPEMFIEAGAYDAYASRRIREICRNTRILALEANPYTFKTAGERYDYKKLGIDYRHTAADETPGSITFQVQKAIGDRELTKSTGNSSLLQRTDPAVSYETVTVKSTTLNEVAAGASSVSMWVDVEGASERVLKGATETLKKTLTAIVEVEIKPFWDGQWLFLDVCKFMAEHGLYPVARDYEYKHQFNIVFCSEKVFETPDFLLELDYYYSLLMGGRKK